MNTACSSFSFLTYGCNVIKKLLVTLKLSYHLLLIVILDGNNFQNMKEWQNLPDQII